ncbi:MAG: Lrp/AsnC family transcriptional regulator [Candidatus Woesearchaeota archaeon]
MKSKDMQILAYLRNNARMPLTKMSKKTQIPVSTLFDRLKASERSFILKHTSLLDFNRLGYHTRANITIKVNKDDKDGLKEFLTKHRSINSVFRITNGYDYMVEAIFKQIKDLEDFLEEMDGKFNIEKRQSYFIIEDIKKEGFMSDPDLINL